MSRKRWGTFAVAENTAANRTWPIASTRSCGGRLSPATSNRSSVGRSQRLVHDLILRPIGRSSSRSSTPSSWKLQCAHRASEIKMRPARSSLFDRLTLMIRPRPSNLVIQLGMSGSSGRTSPTSGVVLLDAPGPRLERLREKASEYGEPKERKKKDGSGHQLLLHTWPPWVPWKRSRWPRSVISWGRAFGNGFQDGRLPGSDAKLWFEVACRGGYRNPGEWSASSRPKINRQMLRINGNVPDEFEAPEELTFFVRLSLTELRGLAASVDCVFTYDVVPIEILTWLLLKDPPTSRDSRVRPHAASEECPGCRHPRYGALNGAPLLKPAVLGAVSVVELGTS